MSFFLHHTIFTNRERRLAVLQDCTKNCDVTLGHHMSFFTPYYLHEPGTAVRRDTGLYEQLQCYARASYIFFLHHTIFTNWERRLAVLQDCMNNCDVTLEHNMFLILQTIFTNRERRLTVKLNRPRQCMRCRGRFGFTRGFWKLYYLIYLFLGFSRTFLKL